MASVGLTGVSDAGIDLANYKLYRQYADEHKLTARIYAMIHGTGDDFDAISKDGPLIGYGNDFLTVRSVKLFAAGALGSRGSPLLKPYPADPPNSGLLFLKPHESPAMTAHPLGQGQHVR